MKQKKTKHKGLCLSFSGLVQAEKVSPRLENYTFFASKTRAPAVALIDKNAGFTVSLVSGHIGGGINRLGQRTACILGAVPVIANDFPAIDMIADSKGMVIETLRIDNASIRYASSEESRPPMIYFYHKTTEVSRETIILRPKNLVVGKGCNKGISLKILRDFLLETFSHQGLSSNSICRMGNIDIKQDETGILQISGQIFVPVD